MQLLSDPLPNQPCPQTSHLLNSFNNPLRLIHAARMLNGVEPSSGVRSTTRIHTLKSNLLFLPWETIKWECCLVWSWASAISQLLGVQGCSGPLYPGDTVLLWFSPPQHLTIIPCLYHHGPRVLGERDGTYTHPICDWTQHIYSLDSDPLCVSSNDVWWSLKTAIICGCWDKNLEVD